MNEQHEEPRSSREMLNFIVLVVILLGAVVIVAATRPLIFGKIVPAVMGEGMTPPVTEEPADTGNEENQEQPAEAGYPATEDEPSTADEAPVVKEETADPETPAGEKPATEEAYPAASTTTDEEAPAEPATEVITHTIKQGETLQLIAGQYDITLQQLIAANKLTNPDYIRVGDKLTIPQAEK